MNLLPESVLYSAPFLVLATFVAMNTMIYAVLAVAKLAPKVYLTDLFRRRDQRRDNRSIYPDPPGQPLGDTSRRPSSTDAMVLHR
jgi:hypothetical protein